MTITRKEDISFERSFPEYEVFYLVTSFKEGLTILSGCKRADCSISKDEPEAKGKIKAGPSRGAY